VHINCQRKCRQSERIYFANTRALQRRKQAQVVVSRAVVSNALSYGLLNIGNQAEQIKKRQRKKSMGETTKMTGYDAGGHGRFMLALCGKGETAEVHSSALVDTRCLGARSQQPSPLFFVGASLNVVEPF